MLSTAAEVFVCCSVANECKLCSRHELDQAILLRSLGLPMPHLAADQDLNRIRIIYNKVLDKHGSHYGRIFKILEKASAEPDATAMLLSFLEYPALVRNSRSGNEAAAPFDEREYPLQQVCQTIATDSRLGKWCREVIAKSDEHHVLVLAICIGILQSSMELEKTMNNLYISIIKENEDFDQGFKRLYEDLGKSVARTQLPLEGIMSALNFLLMTASVGLGSDNVMTTMSSMVGTPSNIYFQKALARLDHEKRKAGFQSYIQVCAGFFFGSPTAGDPDFRKTLQSMLPVALKETKKQPIKYHTCNALNCKNEGSRKCGKCKLVSYCCSDCQVGDWKKHKLVCKGVRPIPNEDIMNDLRSIAHSTHTNSNSVSSKKTTSAKRRQDVCLAENPERDYVIIGAGDTPNTSRVVYFEDANSKRTFKMMRARAVKEPKYVFLLYDVLLKKTMLTLAQTEILRSQLRAEYGVDPLSPTAKDAPCGASMQTHTKPEKFSRASLQVQHVKEDKKDNATRDDRRLAEDSVPSQQQSKETSTINLSTSKITSQDSQPKTCIMPDFRASDYSPVHEDAKVEVESARCLSDITTDISHSPTQAILKQDKVLLANQEYDYIVFGAGDGDQPDHIIDFKIPSIKVMFKERRAKAFFVPSDVIRLYGHIIMMPDMVSPHKRKILRSQLTEEYGIDPFETDEEKDEFEAKLFARVGDAAMNNNTSKQGMDDIIYQIPPELIVLAMVGIVYGLTSSK